MTTVSTYFVENTSARAEVRLSAGVYAIDYYNTSGVLQNSVEYPGQSLSSVETIAENWTLKLENLHG